MAKHFNTIQRNDNCNLDDVSCFSLAPDHRRNAPPLYFIQFAFQYPDLLDPTLSINPFFQHGNGIVNGRPAEMADNSQFLFRNIWVIPDFSQYSCL